MDILMVYNYYSQTKILLKIFFWNCSDISEFRCFPFHYASQRFLQNFYTKYNLPGSDCCKKFQIISDREELINKPFRNENIVHNICKTAVRFFDDS